MGPWPVRDARRLNNAQSSIAATVAGSALGPPIMGVAKDFLGSFAPAIWLFVAFYGILALAALFVTSPRRESRRAIVNT